MDEDLPLQTQLLVGAAMRRCMGDGHFATLLRRGAAERGGILVQRRDRAGALALIGQTRDRLGRPAWLARPMADEMALADATERALNRDDDLWLVEIEAPADYWPFEGAFI